MVICTLKTAVKDIQPGDILKVQVEQGFAYDVVATVVE